MACITNTLLVFELRVAQAKASKLLVLSWYRIPGCTLRPSATTLYGTELLGTDWVVMIIGPVEPRDDKTRTNMPTYTSYVILDWPSGPSSTVLAILASLKVVE